MTDREYSVFSNPQKEKCCFLSAYVVSEEASLLHQTSIPCQTCLCYIKYTSLTEIKFLGSLFLPWLSTSLRGLCCIRSKAAWLKVIDSCSLSLSLSHTHTHTHMHACVEHTESHKHSHLWMRHVADRHMKAADLLEECASFDRLCWCFYF